MSADRWGAEGVIEWASAGRALGGPSAGSESGDIEVVAPFEGGVLVAVIDGLGHGPAAAEAAKAAGAILQAHPNQPVVTLFEKCHEGLRRTRGAVMTLASFDARTSSLTWVGVGNVEGVLLRVRSGAEPRREWVTARGGVVGFQMPPLRPSTISISPGDTLVMATDGIRNSFTSELTLRENLQETANAILASHARQSDDALVVIARYLGQSKHGPTI